MSSVEIDYLGEGPNDDAIARHLITAAAGTPGVSLLTRQSGKGKGSLDKRLRGINAGLAHGAPAVLVLRDLDQDAVCASALVKALVPDPHERLFLRICVRASEAWLLADADAYAIYCGLASSRIPSKPEALENPKAAMMAWASGRGAPKLSRHFKERAKRGVPLWAALADWNRTFVETRWSAVRAAETGRSPSLAQSLHRLRTYVRHRGA
jgi:hypothetical protein